MKVMVTETEYFQFNSILIKLDHISKISKNVMHGKFQ